MLILLLKIEKEEMKKQKAFSRAIKKGKLKILLKRNELKRNKLKK